MALSISIFARHDLPDVHEEARFDDWPAFVRFLATPADVPPEARKEDLPLWSPATFRDGYRSLARVEEVHALVLDIDEAPVPTRDELETAFAGLRFAAHSSSSATALAPRWRGVLALSRPATADEYQRLWLAITSRLPFPVGRAAKDPSRAWYWPRRGLDGFYDLVSLEGEPLDVDAVLEYAPPLEAPRAPETAAPAPPRAPTFAAKRDAAAVLLGRAWPEKNRHSAQLALAGALKREGWTKDEALEFLCNVCREAGDEDRPKRRATIEHTWGTDVVTGWSSLESLLGAGGIAVVRSARDLVNPYADEVASLRAELAERAAAPPLADLPARKPKASTDTDGIRWGGWDEPVPPPVYLVQGLIPEETVGMFVAMGSSLKTWTALDIARCVSKGAPWLDRYPTKQGRALVVDFESGLYELRRRICLLEGGALANLGAWCYPAGYRIDGEDFWREIAKVEGLALVVIDSLSAGAPGIDENETNAALPLKMAARFSEATGAGVLFIHHSRKDDGDDRKMVRGSTAIYADCDWAYRFDPVEETSKHRRMQMLCIKPCMGPKPAPINLELGEDARLRWFDEHEAAKAAAAEPTPEAIQAAIKLALMKGPIETKIKIGKAVGRRRELVDPELEALIVRREVAFVNGLGYTLDDEAHRDERVRTAVRGYAFFATEAQVAKASSVDVDHVVGMVRRGLVARSGEGRFQVIERT